MKTVVITGSSRGFGFALATEFKKRGWNIVLTGVSEGNLKKAEEKLSSINKGNGSILPIIANVTREEDLENLWRKAQDAFGTIDIWINNAGVNSPDKPVRDLTEKEISFILDTDLKGTINGSRIAFREMEKQKSGQIYNIEGYGSNDAMMMGLTLYGTAKRAVTYFTASLSKESEELTHGEVKVCLLTPGIMITDFLTSANGGSTTVVLKEQTKKIYNILGDYPETIAAYCVPRMIENQKNGYNVAWLTNIRAFGKFFKALYKKNDYFKG